MPADRPPLEADDTPIGRDWVEYANALEAELQAAQERERVLDGALMITCVWLAGDEVGFDGAQAFYDEALALAAQRTEEPSA